MRSAVSARNRTPRTVESAEPELLEMAIHGILVARDAVFNLRDLLANPSGVAFLTVKECEKELDHLEHTIDAQAPDAIAAVSKQAIRDLLASVKLITDLERIGDLIFWVAQCVRSGRTQLAGQDAKSLSAMAAQLQAMLEHLHRGFTHRDLEAARSALQSDARIDQLRHGLFRRHLKKSEAADSSYSVNALLMAQSLERAGDHVKNIAEELFHMVEGRSLRHVPPRERDKEFARVASSMS